jgi:hypothetical protein
MKDTKVFLRNQLSRFIPSIHQVDQSYLPRVERRVIHWYAFLWVGGRLAALGSLIFISIPLIYNYSFAVLATLSAGYQVKPYAFVDALFMLLLTFIPWSIGFWLWIRNFSIVQR